MQRRVDALRRVGERRQVVKGVAEVGEVGQGLPKQRQFLRRCVAHVPVQRKRIAGGMDSEIMKEPSRRQLIQHAEQTGGRPTGHFSQRWGRPGAEPTDRQRVANQGVVGVQRDDQVRQRTGRSIGQESPDALVSFQRPLAGQVSVKVVDLGAPTLQPLRSPRRTGQKTDQLGGPRRLRRQQTAVEERNSAGHGRSTPRVVLAFLARILGVSVAVAISVKVVTAGIR